MTNYKILLEMISKRREELEGVIYQLKSDLSNAPKGMLRTARCRNKIQYFRRENKDDYNGTYIKESDIALAKALAQKEYDEGALVRAEAEQKQLDRLIKVYMQKPVEHAGEKMGIEKRKLVEPVEKSDEAFIQEWLAQEYALNNQYKENLKYINAKGIPMRSKSEVLISNILDEFKIPYIYERPLKLGNYKMVSPDFTLLDMRTRKEVYLEHLGLMDDAEYLERNLGKIAAYEDAGFFLGQQLLVTYETSDMPLNINKVRTMLENYFSTNNTCVLV